MHRLVLALIAGIYLVGTLYQITLPGLHYDEAFEAVPAVQLLTNQPVTAFRNSVITIFGTSFPLTTQDYIGALNTYGVLPFLAVMGITVHSLRVYAVLIGLLTLILVYGFTKELTSSRTAGLSAMALLAINPTFLFWSRQGIFVTAITATIGIATAWVWLRWWRQGRYRYAICGAFLIGLGLYAKLLFIWLVVALFGAFVISLIVTYSLNKRSVKVHFDTPLIQIPGLAIAGLIGLAPLLLYNLQTSGTFKSITENAGTSYYGVDNANVFVNLGTRFNQLITLLNSGHLWYLGDIYTNNTMPIIFIGLFIASIWIAVRYGNISSLMPFLVILLVVIQSIVTVSALWITHFAVMMVWPPIAISASINAIIRRVRVPQQQWIMIATGLILLILALTDGLTSVRYHQALTKSGGLSSHSDAIYDMAAWLNQQQSQTSIAMDWGLAAPILVLTEGQVKVEEVFGYNWETDDQFDEVITPHLMPGAAIFLWRSPDEIIFDRSAAFKSLYRPINLEETILHASYERSGRPILGATQLVPVGSAENKPVEP